MRYMRYTTCMALFQQWRRRTGRPTHEMTVDDRDRAKLDDIEEAIIRQRLDAMRPGHSYQDIADSLGITKKTLYEKRKQYNLIP